MSEQKSSVSRRNESITRVVSLWRKYEYIFNCGQEFSIDFLRRFMFLYITQTLPIIFPLKWIY